MRAFTKRDFQLRGGMNLTLRGINNVETWSDKLVLDVDDDDGKDEEGPQVE